MAGTYQRKSKPSSGISSFDYLPVRNDYTQSTRPVLRSVDGVLPHMCTESIDASGSRLIYTKSESLSCGFSSKNISTGIFPAYTHFGDYAPDVRNFVKFLREKRSLFVSIHGHANSDGSDVHVMTPYKHRWTPAYRKSVVAKLFQLNEFVKKYNLPTEMLTLTTYQDGEYSKSVVGHEVTREESFVLLKEGWKKLSDILRESIPDFRYMWVLEPHTKNKSGYPHLHILIFNVVSDNLKQRSIRLWSDAYGAGSRDSGIKFGFRDGSTKVDSVINYLMKYFSKSFQSSDGDDGYNNGTWSDEVWLFNALVHKHRWRLYGAADDITKVMRLLPKESDVTWRHLRLIRGGHIQTMDAMERRLTDMVDDVHKDGYLCKMSDIDVVNAFDSSQISVIHRPDDFKNLPPKKPIRNKLHWQVYEFMEDRGFDMSDYVVRGAKSVVSKCDSPDICVDDSCAPVSDLPRVIPKEFDF